MNHTPRARGVEVPVKKRVTRVGGKTKGQERVSRCVSGSVCKWSEETEKRDEEDEVQGAWDGGVQLKSLTTKQGPAGKDEDQPLGIEEPRLTLSSRLLVEKMRQAMFALKVQTQSAWTLGWPRRRAKQALPLDGSMFRTPHDAPMWVTLEKTRGSAKGARGGFT